MSWLASPRLAVCRKNCRTWFGCTGTDAIDSALRLAHQYFVAQGQPSKSAVIGRWQGFHGNNLAVAGVHGSTPRRRIYYPMYVNQPHVPPAYCYRCPYETTRDRCNLKCACALETLIHQTGEENVACFIAEPVSGSGLGGVPAPDGYFQLVRDICTRHNVLLIVNEVMTGWGRLGYWFGIEHWGVTPDILATAKGMSSGYTAISATIAREEIWQSIEDSGMAFLAGHTLNQNPVSCAGAIANLNYIKEQGLINNVRKVGPYLLERLQELLSFNIVSDVRGLGLLTGFELVKDRSTKEPFDPKQKVNLLFEQEAMRRGLSIYPCNGCVDGALGDMILVLPPLITTCQQVDEIVSILKKTTAAVQEQTR